MPIATHPSSTSPLMPSFRLDLPEGWCAVPAAGVLLAAASGSGAGGVFRPNVTVTAERVLAGVDLGSIASAFLADLRGYKDFTVAGDWTGRVAGQQARWQEYAFTDPQAGTLYQIQVLLFAPMPEEAAVKDLIQVHATCAGSDAPTLYETLRGCAQSLRFGQV